MNLFAGQLLLDDLDLALCGIGADGLQLILSGDHLAVLGAGALQVDGVKLALGGADAAADALVRVYVPTDFDTKEKAFSGAKAAGKGIK